MTWQHARAMLPSLPWLVRALTWPGVVWPSSYLVLHPVFTPLGAPIFYPSWLNQVGSSRLSQPGGWLSHTRRCCTHSEYGTCCSFVGRVRCCKCSTPPPLLYTFQSIPPPRPGSVSICHTVLGGPPSYMVGARVGQGRGGALHRVPHVAAHLTLGGLQQVATVAAIRKVVGCHTALL